MYIIIIIKILWIGREFNMYIIIIIIIIIL